MDYKINSTIRLGLPLVLCASVIAWLSLSEAPPSLPSRFLGWDKVGHALAYAMLTAFAGLAARSLFSDRAMGWVAAFIFSLSFGGMMEVLQQTVTRNRTAEWGDLLADAVGAGITIGVVFFRYFSNRRQPPPRAGA